MKTDTLTAPAEKTPWIDRGWYLAVEFELSKSGRYEEAIEMAKENSQYVELVDERGITWHRAIFFKKDFPVFNDLYDMVKAWRGTRFYLKGDELKKDDFAIWYECFARYWGHRKELLDHDYCGTDKFLSYPKFLGCYDRNIGLEWRDPIANYYGYRSKSWYAFGKRDKNAYRIDKEAILKFLTKANRDYISCPCYGHALIEHYLHKLPNEIDPLLHTEWQWKDDYLKIGANRGFMSYDAFLSAVPEICPISQKAYQKFMVKIFKG